MDNGKQNIDVIWNISEMYFWDSFWYSEYIDMTSDNDTLS